MDNLLIPVVVAFVAGLLTIISTLTGVAIAGLIDWLRQERAFKHENEWKRSELRREKLELIASTANEEYSRLVGLVKNLRNIAVVKEGHFGDDAWREIYKQQKELGSARLPFLEMLVAFYAPDLSEQIDSLKAAQGALGRPTAGVMTGAMNSVDASTEAFKALQDARAACRELIEAAANLAREELGHRPSKACAQPLPPR